MINKIILSAFFIVLGLTAGHAQETDKLKNASWVRIMQNDTSVNYFEARQDFSKVLAEYRKEKAEEKANDKKEMNDHKGPQRESHLEDRDEMLIMSYQKWARSIQPYVSADGKIIPVEQRVKMVSPKK